MATKYSTAAVGRHQAEGIFHAVRFANDNGRALNLLVTIDLTQLGFSEQEAGDRFRAIWKSTARWWNYERSKGRQIGSFDAYAVHENPRDIRHVHWLMHVPRCLWDDLPGAIQKRVCKAARLDCLGDALHFLPVTRPGGVTKYALKGVDPFYAPYFHMDAVPQGVVSGRRISVSRSIGRAARQRVGWVRKRAGAQVLTST